MNHIDTMKLALEALETGKNHGIAIDVLRRALAEQPAPPPECQTEAEKTAFAFGWWKALEQKRKADSALDRMADNARELGLDYEPIVEQVEDSVGMGHGAWDMVEPKKLAKAFHEALAEPPCKTGSQCTNKCPQCDEPAQQQRWAVFCSQCRKEWSVSYPHPGKSICAECDAKVGAQQQKEGFASPGGGYVPAIPRPIPLDWKLVPRKATPEMLRAMDECAQEGYDERLYEGMASSVYMAAWDASPVLGTLPPSEKERSMMDIIVGNLVRKGINKHRARELAEHFIKHTSPPKSKPWVGLTDEDIDQCLRVSDGSMGRLLSTIEAKLKEKNT